MKRRYTGIVVFLLAVVALVTLMTQNPAYTEDKEQSEKPAKADAVTMATAPPPDFKHDMEAALEFIEKNPLGFLATVDNGKPRVRAFSILKTEGDTLYFGTSNTRAVFVQLKDNLLAEWVTMDPTTYTTLRVLGEVVFVDDIEMKREVIASMPMLEKMYAGEKEKEFEMFYLRNVELNWFGFSLAPKEAQEEMDQ
ncbi:MAG: pyridoxamine 5'-phosphate oxidase family protein [Candidatus Eisenbacteria bacterium]